MGSVLNGLSAVYLGAKRYADAERAYREALRIFEDAVGEENVATIAVLSNLGQLLEETGRVAEAIPVLREAERRMVRAVGEGNVRVGVMRWKLGNALQTARRWRGAAEAHAAALRVF